MVQMESESELERGEPAPDFSLTGTDGDTYAPASFADDEALLLVFTCNHCPYAQAKVETLNAIAADYDDCAVVGINPNDPAEYPEDSYERMCELVEDATVRYDAYLFDETQETARAYGAVCTPDPFLFARRDADGGDGHEWVLAYHGRLDDALNPDDEPSGDPGFEIRRAINAVLAGEEVPVPDRPSRGCSIKWRDA